VRSTKEFYRPELGYHYIIPDRYLVLSEQAVIEVINRDARWIETSVVRRAQVSLICTSGR